MKRKNKKGHDRASSKQIQRLKNKAEIINLEKELQKLSSTASAPIVNPQQITKPVSRESMFEKKIFGVPTWIYIIFPVIFLIISIIYIIIVSIINVPQNTPASDNVTCKALADAKQKSIDATKKYEDYDKTE